MSNQDERAAFEAWFNGSKGRKPTRLADGCYFDDWAQCAWRGWQARAALSAAAKPEGWKLVPVEPTQEMLDAAEQIDWGDADVRSNCINMWQAMLSAAPSAPGAEQAKPVQAMTDEQWHAELWKLAVRKGLVTVHSVLMDERNPGTRCSWIQGHDKASDISNDAAAWGVKLEGGV